jgi:hypothetical protein|uniref:hypothetical protein n=1 Tax=Orrella sp. TaxID=1921583 RepID=UPI0040555BFC
MVVAIKQWIQQVSDRAREMLDMRSSESPVDDLISQCHVSYRVVERPPGWP